MIIDVHTHLGDILYSGGGRLIFQKGVVKKAAFDLISATEKGLYKSNAMLEWLLDTLFTDTIAKACQYRNATATLENMRASMDENGVIRSVCLPIPPNLTFDDLKAAGEIDDGIIPFTGVDFSADFNPDAVFRNDVAQGARGLKLHPILQQEPLNSKKTYAAVEAFAVYGLPVLFHAGVQSYYLGQEKETRQRPDYGEPSEALALVQAFPQTSFIVGHAGIFQYRETIGLFSSLKNTYVDTSFQSPARIRELIQAFGPDRVMFGSDWPWGDRRTNIVSASKACSGDRSLERAIYYDNAARLLGT
jgi:uncharacterized protein